MDWYRHLGWSQVYKCAKLERKMTGGILVPNLMEKSRMIKIQ